MGSNITLVVTSCDRHDFLKKTLDGLISVHCGGAKPDRCIIIEDGSTPMPDWLRDNIHYYSSNLGTVEWVSNETRMGQVYSIDRAYSMVKTDYIFHCEDDYEWLLSGSWMTDSKSILEKYPTISMVSLRGNDCNQHPNIDYPPYEGFKIQMPGWRNVWGGINYNPGLRRLSDYKRVGSYGKYTVYGAMGLDTEIPISELYLKLGYRIAVLPSPDGKYSPFVKHFNVASRMKDGYVIPLPKILIAIPVCHKYSYTKWESAESPLYDQSTAWEGKPYGTDIHISGDNNRVAALRDTWLKDVAKNSNHVEYRLFFGESHDREPLADEVFLKGVPDDYANLRFKTYGIVKWAFDNGFDFVFKADDDTLVNVGGIVQEILQARCDYGGYLHGKVATGGTGYWLSKRAMKEIVRNPLGSHWAEDVSVAKIMDAANIQPVHLAGHRSGREDHWFWKEGKFDPTLLDGTETSIHAVQPEVMRQWYEWKEKK